MIKNYKEILRNLQLTQLEILRVIDGFCKENSIEYSLYAGTLLGAVRHKGFIPWDDDLDICLSRENYNRFIKLWERKGPTGYLIQNKENSPDFSQTFSKIRKDKTTFLQAGKGDALGNYHKGIFVDVFPIDRIPTGKFKRFVFIARGIKYQLYTRGYPPTENGKIIELLAKLILVIVPKKQQEERRKKLIREIIKENGFSTYPRVAIETFGTIRTPLPYNLLDEYTDIEFENGIFRCFKHWDEYLKLKFGDYMKLPPDDEQTWRHYPLVIDFEHNFDEIVCL